MGSMMARNGASLRREKTTARQRESARELLSRARTLGAVCSVDGADPKDAVAKAKELIGAGRLRAEGPGEILCLAAAFDAVELVELFMDAGARADELCGGETALMAAAQAGAVLAMKALIGRGARVEQQGEFKERALHKAARCEDPRRAARAIRALLAAGAEAEARNSVGQTAMMVAAERLNERACQELSLRGADGGGADRAGKSPFMSALLSLDGKAPQKAGPKLKALVGAGVAPRGAGSSGWTPMGFALSFEGERGRGWIKTLHEAGADVNEPLGGGETALARCLRGSDGDERAEVEARVALLLSLGADPGIADAQGRRPIDGGAPYDGAGRSVLMSWEQARELEEGLGASAGSKKGPRI